MEYKKLQEWSRDRLRTVIGHPGTKPGDVVIFSDGKRYEIQPNGQRVRIFPDAPMEARVQAK